MSSVFSERSSVGGGVQLHLFNETHKWQRLCLALIMVCGWWKRWPPILRQSNTAHSSLYIRQRQIEPRPCQSTDFRTRKIAIYCLLALHLRIIARSHDIFVVRPFMVVLVYAAVCNDIYSTFHKSARRLYLVCSTNRSEHTNTTNKKIKKNRQNEEMKHNVRLSFVQNSRFRALERLNNNNNNKTVSKDAKKSRSSWLLLSHSMRQGIISYYFIGRSR